MIDTIVEWSIDSYGLLPLMSVLLLVVIAIIIERAYFYVKVLEAGTAIEDEVQRVGYHNTAELKAVADRYADAPQTTLLNTALEAGANDAETMDRRIEESILLLLPQLDRNLWLVDTSVTLAPLLGLLGTIIGMIQSFNVLGTAAKGNPDLVTGGIAHALVATAFGLLIAIIAVFFLNYFNKKNRLALHQLELLKTMVVNRFHGSSAPAAARASSVAV